MDELIFVLWATRARKQNAHLKVVWRGRRIETLKGQDSDQPLESYRV